ncbi:hypothetical protein [Lysinibacillus sp. G4S2]|uniref:hypothetical protein n=1 Tax=Lysinibacillus sp. G4S2 TaxID=3055859 RepID=UPI0025A23AE5|nr:hypothetical protein [Lysinibacillus sp. G4S2]MDM5245966.1 hypothetical protein [Lysinibacillus sp. G4S2]
MATYLHSANVFCSESEASAANVFCSESEAPATNHFCVKAKRQQKLRQDKMD